MVDKTIPELAAATTPVADADLVPISQGGGDAVNVALSDLTAGRAVSAANLTVTSSTIPTNGIYLPAADTVGIAANGALVVSVSASIVTLASGAGLTLANGRLIASNTATNTTAATFISSAQTVGAFSIEADALTTGFGAQVYSNSASASIRALINIINDHASATGAVLQRLQQDAAGAFCNLVGAAGANVTAPISTFVAVPGALAGWEQVQVNGAKRWRPLYNDPVS